jgi:hypothetical protein
MQQLSQYMSNPTRSHYQAAMRVLRYLKAAPGKGIFFPRSSEIRIMGFSDADWGGCPNTRLSITGYCFYLGDSLICWRAKKQATVSKSSSEAGYRALASATCELQWISYLLTYLHLIRSHESILYCDNQSALYIAANPIFHERTKHLEIDCHIVREKCRNGLMRLIPVASHAQIADGFTKSLAPQPFARFVAKLGLVDIFKPSA